MIASFDPQHAGTPEQSWLAGGLDELSRLSAPGAGDRLLVLAAHPDDESLGAGGLIAMAAANGADVVVVVVTDGEASHPHSTSHSPAELAKIRRAELRAAIRELAPTASTVFLGLPDGAIAAHSRELSSAIKDRLAGCSHVATPWIGDRHPDHEACARATEELVAQQLATGRGSVQHWQFPIWAWEWADPAASDVPMSRLGRLDLSTSSRRCKQAAIACYRSQHTPLSHDASDAAILPYHVLDHFAREFECFVVEPAPSMHPAASAEYFDTLYAENEDPWGFADRFYERRKRSLILASLPRPRFRRAFEPGCATGLLTCGLAGRCDEVVAWDGALAGVRQARARLASAQNVDIGTRRIPGDWPQGAFDLIVLSEIGYYCVDLAALTERVSDSLTSDGVVLACHWMHPAPDHPHDAVTVHAALGRGLHLIAEHVERDFRLDVWSRDARSVAALDGIVP